MDAFANTQLLHNQFGNLNEIDWTQFRLDENVQIIVILFRKLKNSMGNSDILFSLYIEKREKNLGIETIIQYTQCYSHSVQSIQYGKCNAFLVHKGSNKGCSHWTAKNTVRSFHCSTAKKNTDRMCVFLNIEFQAIVSRLFQEFPYELFAESIIFHVNGWLVRIMSFRE